MRRAGIRGFLYYSWKGLGYLIRGVFRGLGLAFLLVVLLALAAALALRVAFDQERVRSLCAAQLQELLHRPVQIDRVLLEPHGVKLKGLRVWEGTGQPGRTLLTSDTVLVTVDLSALLHRRLELDQVRLVAPSIQLVRDAAGEWNWADVFASTHAAQAVPVGRFSLPVSLAAERTRIEGGMVSVEDRLRDRRYRFDNVGLVVERFALDRPFAFTVACDNSSSLGGRTVKSRLAARGVALLAGFDWSQAYVRAKSLELTVDGVGLRGSGSAAGLWPLELEFDGSLPALGPEDWRRLLARDLELRLPPSGWRLQATWTEPGRLNLRQLRLDIPALAAEASAEVDLAGASLKGELSVKGFPLARTAELYPPWAPLGLRGELEGEAAVAGPWGAPQLERGRLRVRGAGGRFKSFNVEDGELALSATQAFSELTLSASGARGRVFSIPFSEVAATLSLRHDELRCERLSGKVLDSRISLKARLRDLKNLREVALRGSIDRLRWEQAQSLVAGLAAKLSGPSRSQPSQPLPWVRTFKYTIPKTFPDTVGHITVGSVTHRDFAFSNVNLLWDVRGVSPSLQRVSGDVHVDFGPGRVADIPALQASNKFLRIVFLPFIYMHKMNSLSTFNTAAAYPKSLDFTRIEGDYGVSRGVVLTRLFHVDSPQMVAYSDGIADFGRETVDMGILTRLTSYRGTLPEWWVDQQGRAAIAFRVKGDLNAPELEPRLSKMGEDEIERTLAAAWAKTKKRTAALEKLRQL